MPCSCPAPSSGKSPGLLRALTTAHAARTRWAAPASLKSPGRCHGGSTATGTARCSNSSVPKRTQRAPAVAGAERGAGRCGWRFLTASSTTSCSICCIKYVTVLAAPSIPRWLMRGEDLPASVTDRALQAHTTEQHRGRLAAVFGLLDRQRRVRVYTIAASEVRSAQRAAGAHLTAMQMLRMRLTALAEERRSSTCEWKGTQEGGAGGRG